MSDKVQVFEQEVMFLSQTRLWNLIRALKAEQLILFIQVLYVLWMYLKNTFEKYQKFNQSFTLIWFSTLPFNDTHQVTVDEI